MPAKLNYSKWDRLELSDESDVEVHPNVDKKSFIRWKQRDIHEKRDERKGRIAFLRSEIDLNNTLEPKIDAIITGTSKEGSPYFERTVSELSAKKGDTSSPRPNTGKAGQPSYDDMVLALLTTVADEVKAKGIKDTEERNKALEMVLKDHRRQLVERTQQCKKQIDDEEAEQQKRITSEDIREGFSTGHVNKNAATSQIVDPIKPVPKAKKASAEKVKQKATEIEVLNPKSSGSQLEAAETSGYAPDSGLTDTAMRSNSGDKVEDDDEDDEEEEEAPTLTPNAVRFSKLERNNWEACFKAISAEPSLLKSETEDAILVEAFESAMRGEKRYAESCVRQATILQYCRKLGKDGVAMFFKRMASNKDALKVFEDDVRQTWQRISKRSTEMVAERAAAGINSSGEREQIQLVSQDPNTTINFEVPDGPPPEQLTLEGEGSENLDVEQVRDFLQKRWDIFESFPKNFKKALVTKNLEEVNRVLGRMSVEEGEETVKLLDEAGILSFSSSEIVDRTQSG